MKAYFSKEIEVFVLDGSVRCPFCGYKISDLNNIPLKLGDNCVCGARVSTLKK